MPDTTRTRLARCGCGALRAQTHGEPAHVYLCACRTCQIKSGSAFTYAAVFAEGDVAVSGARRGWRHYGESGQWIESLFCPACGITVLFLSEGLPGMTGIAVGCFTDADFPKPRRMYWASRKHAWLDVPEGVEPVETQ